MDVILRCWRTGDEEALIGHANDREVWRTLRNAFPQPYTARDAEAWIRSCVARGEVATHLAIARADDATATAIGGVGWDALADVYAVGVEIGYWVARAWWRRGVATRALELATRRALASDGVERVQAHVYATHAASIRVLEKAGYRLEGRLRRAVRKDGVVGDALLYAFVRDDL